MSYTMRSLLLAICSLMLLAAAGSAHRSNESYVYFDVTDTSLTGRFEAALGDLDGLLGIDLNGNALFEPEEIDAASDRIFEFLSGRLSLSHDGRPLGIEPTGIEVLDAGHVGVFAQVGFRVTDLDTVPDAITVDYEPLTELLTDHGGYALIASNQRVGLEENEAYISLTFSDGQGPQRLSLTGEPYSKVFVEFAELGIWHAWLGMDHVVFLAALLLSAVMVGTGGTWVPGHSLVDAGGRLFRLVTMFVFANLITMSLSGLGYISLPQPAVDAAIAASLVALAGLNLAPSAQRFVPLAVLAFGVFHGLGFANLAVLSLFDPSRQAVSLIAFSVGLEVAHLVAALAVLPVLWLVHRWRVYPFVAFKVGTAVLVLLAGIWFLESTTDFEFNMRATVAMLTGVAL